MGLAGLRLAFAAQPGLTARKRKRAHVQVPSIPETQHLGGRKAAAGLPEARGSALRLFEVSGGADSTGNGGGTSSH